MHALQDAWARSQLWDAEHGWEVNFKKTQYLKVGPDCAYLETPMGVLPPTPSLCLLGYDILAHGKFAMARMETRITEAKTTAARMARTPLPPWVMKQVVAVALLPKLAFGPHPRPLTQSVLMELRAAVKRAMHVEFRAYSWDMLMTCSFPVHRVDPANYVAYVHVMGIVRAVQESQKVQRAWQTIYDQNTACNGLCATYKTYMKRLHIDDQEDPFTWLLGEERIDIRSMPRKKTGPQAKTAHETTGT